MSLMRRRVCRCSATNHTSHSDLAQRYVSTDDTKIHTSRLIARLRKIGARVGVARYSTSHEVYIVTHFISAHLNAYRDAVGAFKLILSREHRDHRLRQRRVAPTSRRALTLVTLSGDEWAGYRMIRAGDSFGIRPNALRSTRSNRILLHATFPNSP